MDAGLLLPSHLLANARVLPDRGDILPLLPKGGVVVEVGVALGDFSQRLIDVCAPSLFVAIDIFRIHEYPALWGRPTAEVFGGRTHGDFYRHRFADLIASGRMRVMDEDSTAALARLDDHSVDVFYVDADHTYQAVSRELSVIKRKIRDDGIIVMNDYTMVDIVGGMEPYGVIQATNEFMLAEQWEMIFLALQPYMYCDVVLRKLGAPRPPSEIEMLRNSTSWRMTAPLRRLMDALRGGPLVKKSFASFSKRSAF